MFPVGPSSMLLGSLAQGGSTARGGQSGFNAILAFSIALESSPCEEIEDLRRVSPVLGLKRKAIHREDVVEPKLFYF